MDKLKLAVVERLGKIKCEVNECLVWDCLASLIWSRDTNNFA